MKIVLALLALLCADSVHAEDHFTYNQDASGLIIRLGTQPIATYVYDDPKIPRPYFCDVHAPDGTPITRTHPPDPEHDKGNDDHADFHPGIWLAFGDIGGADVWRLKARVAHVAFEQEPIVEDGKLRFAVRNRYETLDTPPRVICEEACRYSLLAQENGWVLLSESTFTSPAGFAFGDQEEMGLGIRLATGLTVKHGAGTIVNSEGGKDEKGTWGKAATWCAAYGPVNGGLAGALVVPSPKNFRTSWFHSRDYGLVVANPFGKKAMTGPKDDGVAPDSTVVTKDAVFSLSFGLYVFSSPENTPAALEKIATDLAKAF